jgi:hypothetical protein
VGAVVGADLAFGLGALGVFIALLAVFFAVFLTAGFFADAVFALGGVAGFTIGPESESVFTAAVILSTSRYFSFFIAFNNFQSVWLDI